MRRRLRTARWWSLAALLWLMPAPRALAQDSPDTEGLRREPVSVGGRFEALNEGVGLRAGAWLLLPAAVLKTGYDSNPAFADRADEPSAFLSVRGSFEARRGGGQSSLEIEGFAGATRLPDARLQDTEEAGLELRGAVSLPGRWDLRGSAGILTEAEPQSASDGVETAGGFDRYQDRAQVRRIPVSLSAAQDLGRTFVLAELTAADVHAGPRRTMSGLRIAQDFRNGLEGEVRLRAGYRVEPNTGLFAELRRPFRRFDDPNADNTGWRMVLGGQAEFTRLLLGEVTLGYAEQTYASGDTVEALVFGGQLTWFAREILSLTLSAQRDFEGEQEIRPDGFIETQPVLRDRFSVRAEYEPLRRWLLTAEAAYDKSTSEDPERTVEFNRLSLGSAFVLTRNFRLTADYELSKSNSTQAGEIVRHLVSVGLQSVY